MHSFLCFSKIGFLHDIDLYLDSLSLEICDFDSKQLSLPVAISACRAAPMGANPLGHTFKPLTLYDISIYTIYFSHPAGQLCFGSMDPSSSVRPSGRKPAASEGLLSSIPAVCQGSHGTQQQSDFLAGHCISQCQLSVKEPCS